MFPFLFQELVLAKERVEALEKTVRAGPAERTMAHNFELFNITMFVVMYVRGYLRALPPRQLSRNVRG